MQQSGLTIKHIPDAPGIYFFLGKNKRVLYIGKATSLRDRVKSYFVPDIAEVRSPLIAKIIADAVSVDFIETESVLEALILEAKLIKKHQPVGNIEQKDNKSWSYLVITNERFPRVLVIRERELQAKFGVKGIVNSGQGMVKEMFGPFPSAATLREALKIIRKIFPFFDTPFPIMSDVRRQTLSGAEEKRIQFNQAIGLYPKEFDEKEYAKTIRAVTDIFSARKDTLIKRLEKEMYGAAKKQEFEKAEELKRKVFALKHIRDVTLIRDELRAPEAATFRIEAYDVAHTRGASPRGVMVVVENGEPKKSDYRLFTINGSQHYTTKQKSGHPMSTFRGDDYAALEEMLTRRAKHREWPYPQLVVIDGGRAHLNRAKKTLHDVGILAEAVSVVKDEKHRPREILGPGRLTITHEPSILLANAEAHRFAISKHRKALRKRLR